jgi:hypothetical protein
MKSGLAIAAAILVVLFLTVGAAYRDNYGTVAPRDAPLYGGIGAEPPTGTLVVSGILVDAGCANRTQENLASAPTPLNQLGPAEPPQEAVTGNAQRAATGFATRDVEPQPPGITAFGITVDKQTLDQEQSDVLTHQVKDLYTRQPDSSCAITGDTRAFALLTDKGRMLNLDGGGDTWAWQAVQSTDAGRALLNGTGSPFKPHVVVKGQIWADQLIVESLSL